MISEGKSDDHARGQRRQSRVAALRGSDPAAGHPPRSRQTGAARARPTGGSPGARSRWCHGATENGAPLNQPSAGASLPARIHCRSARLPMRLVTIVRLPISVKLLSPLQNIPPIARS